MNTSTTPSQTVAQTDNAALERFGDPTRPPLLIVYSLVNQPSILDFAPQRSMIARLVEGGYCVYLLAWHPPGQAQRFVSLSDYIAGDIADAAATISQAHEQPAHLLGVCQGGVLALCYAAIASHYPGLDARHIRSVITLATPINTAHADDRLARLAREIDFDALVSASGNISGERLAAVFASLKPFALGPRRYASLASVTARGPEAVSEFMRMEDWMYAGPDLAGQAFAEFAQEIYQNNALANGTLVIEGERIALSDIQVPTFSAYATDDHLVPPASARGLSHHLSASCTEWSVAGGHLGLFISRRAHRELYPALLDWLNQPGRRCSAATKGLASHSQGD